MNFVFARFTFLALSLSLSYVAQAQWITQDLRQAGLVDAFGGEDSHENHLLYRRGTGGYTLYFPIPHADFGQISPYGYDGSLLFENTVAGYRYLSIFDEGWFRFQGGIGDPTEIPNARHLGDLGSQGYVGTLEGSLAPVKWATPTSAPVPFALPSFGNATPVSTWADLTGGTRYGSGLTYDAVVWNGSTVVGEFPNALLTEVVGRGVLLNNTHPGEFFTYGVTYGYFTPGSNTIHTLNLSNFSYGVDLHVGNVIGWNKHAGYTFANVDRMFQPENVPTPFDCTALSCDSKNWYVQTPIVPNAPSGVAIRPVTSAPGTALQSTTFGSPLTPGPIAGQDGWTMIGAGPTTAAQVTASGFQGDTGGLSIGGSVLNSGVNWIYKAIPGGYDANATSNKSIYASMRIKVPGGSIGPTPRLNVGLSAWSGSTERGSVMIDPAGFVTISANGNSNSIEYACADNWLLLTMELNHVTNKINAYVNGVRLPFNMPLISDGTLTDFDITVNSGGPQQVYIDDFRVTSSPSRLWIRADADFQDWVGPNHETTRWSVSGPSGLIYSNYHSPTDYIVLDSQTSAGNFVFKAKGRHWLAAETTANIASDSEIFLSLINGDCDDDNEVGPGDFGQLSAAFGSVDGDGNWDENADLDGDGEVGPSDFGILSANFGQSGVEFP